MVEIKNLTDKFRINLKHLRNMHGLSQSVMAKEIGISTRGYQRIESGDSLPTLDLIFKIALTLKVEVTELFNYTSESDTYTELSKQEIINFKKGAEFIKFTEELVDKYSTVINQEQSDWMRNIAIDGSFLSNSMPIYISDLVNTIANESCSEILARKAGTKIISGSKLKEQKNKISIINRIYLKNEVYFKTSHIYDLGKKHLNTTNCTFYKRSNSGQNILIGYIIDYSQN